MTDGPNTATVASDLEVVDVDRLGRVHIVGLGGAGMSGIARILLGRGVPVSGSDVKDNRRLHALRALGARTVIGHAEENLDGGGAGVDTVMYSTAIPPDNPELVAARARGLRVMERSAGLASVMRGSRVIAVGGTHGKTTTTSMVTVALQQCGTDPSYVVGSELSETGSNGHVGAGDLFVVEADESDGCFLRLEPEVAIVTNVEADHLNFWGDLAAIEDGFARFVGLTVPRGGFAVVCIDDPGGRRLAQVAADRGVAVRTYGTDAGADYRLTDVRTGSFGVRALLSHRGAPLGALELSVPGNHNALNATAALAAVHGLGIPADCAVAGLARFTGTRRRFDFRGEVDGIRVYDDYAHHPTEIDATLRAARGFAGRGRLIVAFQAHHYYRTALFLHEFGRALGLADDVVVLEVFAPGETPIPGASGQAMAAAVPLPPGHVVFEPSWSRVADRLAERARPGDLVMTLGAGDISLLGPEVLDILRRRAGAANAGTAHAGAAAAGERSP